MKQKILVVDDEPEAVELIEFNLKQAGYDVKIVEWEFDDHLSNRGHR